MMMISMSKHLFKALRRPFPVVQWKRSCSAMENVKLYASNNEQQFRDSQAIVEEFLSKMKWTNDQSNELILDIGCGSGNVTRDVLWASLPKEQQSKTLLLGLDLSEHMIEFANSNFAIPPQRKIIPSLMDLIDAECLKGIEPGVTYAQLDASKSLPPTFPTGIASKVFSFNCLHYAKDQDLAHTNFFQLLRQGGEALSIFMAKYPSRQAYKELAKRERWAPFMTDVSNLALPFDMEEDQAGKLRNVLEKVGFQVNWCEVRKKSYTFPTLDTMKNMVQSMMPFKDRIKDGQERDEFVKQTFDEIIKINEQNKVKEGLNDGEQKTLIYSIYVVHVLKP